MSVKIAAQFKKDTRELNGLDAIEEELIEEPLKRRLIIAEIETKRITRDIDDGGTEIPTIKLLHIEPLDGDAEETARGLLNAAYKARTGKDESQAQLPFGEGDQAEDGPVSERPKDEWLDKGEGK